MARQRENKAAEKFSKIKGKRQEMFMKAFEHISGKIDDIYKELTKTFASPMGGSAYLTLESDDEPYLHGIKYHAMPPMKRFRDMELLSGGEKTMAALALLFAIHSFHPSPFFVLDEVDAALDSANVNKIANYIKKISSPTFQMPYLKNPMLWWVFIENNGKTPLELSHLIYVIIQMMKHPLLEPSRS
ncbi:hypothetical protein CANTEDRAFT_114616 [Yamadazyma tenuis ATCC 10573]|uniref:RecF/RecN/SMC N-terminal domain-containing protein n=1 Tax=Candida tenuis (strain ATCC 10573 / BCRC 21748 / CBS 615 / JCM 9827 / NBRC 10315 / NRRL Y-1498 / VKM Y-70) TaxID=590646 RepID=G3B5W6_CANTC|nr:uncharacterized protein CANTEDRAFT_114616 [Yamadazyma tenuis ATCC 10573]EGV63322.1 hypothetical protein CANTEDRAFT_114616 [Yamadazyma tenuis ATCC 10573]